MRQDRFIRLQELSERLTDVVLDEANPDAWPGAGAPLESLSRDDRGDRYWCKKNAAATLSLLTKTISLLPFARKALDPNAAPGDTGPVDDHEGDIAAEMKDAEAQAEKLLAKLAARKATHAQRSP